MNPAVAEVPVLGLEGLPDLIEADEVNLLDSATYADMDHREIGSFSDAHTGRRHLSHNSISTLEACRQKYGFSYDLGIQRIGKALPLTMGGAFQKGVEEGDGRVAIETFIKDAGPTYSQEDEDQRRINATVVGAAAKAYLNAYGPPIDNAVREYGYRVQLRSPWTGAYSRTFDLLGFADELIDHGDEYELIENKLVGQIAPLQIRKLPLDRQLALTCYAVWRATGKKVTKVRYRLTRKPSIKPKKATKTKPAESVEEFCERLVADYADRPDFYLHEEAFTRSASDLVRIEAELWEWAEGIRAAEKRRMWPRNTSYCHEYGGCAFLPICLGDPDALSLFESKSSTPTPANESEDA